VAVVLEPWRGGISWRCDGRFKEVFQSDSTSQNGWYRRSPPLLCVFTSKANVIGYAVICLVTGSIRKVDPTNFFVGATLVAAPCISVLYFSPVSFFARGSITTSGATTRVAPTHFSAFVVCCHQQTECYWLRCNLFGYKEQKYMLVTTPTLVQKRVLVNFVA